MRNITLAVAAATLAVPVATALPSTAAVAATSNSDAAKFQRRYYNRRGEYVGPTWRGRDGRYRCRRPNGTTGLIIGGLAGGLIGNQVAGRGDHLLGTVIGAGAGALLGREVDRRTTSRRCR